MRILILIVICVVFAGSVSWLNSTRQSTIFTFDIGPTEITAKCFETKGPPVTREYAFEAVKALGAQIMSRSEDIVALKATLVDVGATAAERDKAAFDLATLEDDPKMILQGVLDEIETEFGCVLG